jgi:hypothetical protein
MNVLRHEATTEACYNRVVSQLIRVATEVYDNRRVVAECCSNGMCVATICELQQNIVTTEGELQ